MPNVGDRKIGAGGKSYTYTKSDTWVPTSGYVPPSDPNTPSSWMTSIADMGKAAGDLINPPKPPPSAPAPTPAAAATTTGKEQEGDRKVVSNVAYVYSAEDGWVTPYNYTAPGDDPEASKWRLPTAWGYKGPSTVTNPYTNKKYYYYMVPWVSGHRRWFSVPKEETVAAHEKDLANRARMADEEMYGKPGDGNMAATKSESEDLVLPEAPDVGANYDYETPEVDTDQFDGFWDQVGATAATTETPDVSDTFAGVLPDTPDVGANFDDILPDDLNVGAHFDDVLPGGMDVGANYDDALPDTPDTGVFYDDVGDLDNLGDQLAGNYDKIDYEENVEEINSLYDDMMKLYNWDEVQGNVLQAGAVGNRMALTGDLGGRFMAGQRQADISTQGALMARKQDFLGALVDIQQQRANALVDEHRLAEKYGIDIDLIQAGMKSDEDLEVRNARRELDLLAADSRAEMGAKAYDTEADINLARSEAETGAEELEYSTEAEVGLARAGAETRADELEYSTEATAELQRALAKTGMDEIAYNAEATALLQEALAQVGMDQIKFQAILEAGTAGETGLATALSNALLQGNAQEAVRLLSKADAETAMDREEYATASDAVIAAAQAEAVTIDVSTALGLPGKQDPTTGEVTLSTGETISTTSMNIIANMDNRIKFDGNDIDIRSALSTWVARNPKATEKDIKERASLYFRTELREIADAKEEGDPHGWVNEMMTKIFGDVWHTDFPGTTTKAEYRYAAPGA